MLCYLSRGVGITLYYLNIARDPSVLATTCGGGRPGSSLARLWDNLGAISLFSATLLKIFS